MTVPLRSAPLTFLGIEGGGTHTTAIHADAEERLLGRVETGPANFRLLDDAALEARLRTVHGHFPSPAAVGIGLAGVRESADRRRLLALAQRVWPRIPIFTGNDLETALAAAPLWPGPKPKARVVIISGTGSCVYGATSVGRTLKVGGWGHQLGDRGSGYDVGLSALRESIRSWDSTGRWPRLGSALLRTLLLNEANDLIPWMQKAEKADVAALSPTVFDEARHGDRLAKSVVANAAAVLAEDALTCASRLVQRGRWVDFVLTGGVLLHQQEFALAVRRKIKNAWPKARVQLLQREGAWGGVAWARKLYEQAKVAGQVAGTGACKAGAPIPRARAETTPPPRVEWKSAETSPTEQRNPRSRLLDRLPVEKAVRLMIDEDRRLPDALLEQAGAISRAVKLVATAFQKGGRLFYVGAGTSGRLGVLDASECPPTFRVSPDQVQGIMAGGAEALWRSIEGAEDDPVAGEQSVLARGVGRGDVLMGIAASGRTPFVWGALQAARARGARTVFFCCNPFLMIPRELRPDVVIAPNVGPEILTGSTRLKSGTVTKMTLNIITTLAMVRTGKVVGNLMVDLNPSNEKLKDRAVRIVREITGRSSEECRALLEKADWVVKVALRLAGVKLRR